MQKKHCLLFVIHHLPFFISHRLVLARHARSLGYRVCVMANPHACCHELESLGIEFYPLVSGRHQKNIWREIGVLYKAHRMISKIQPDLIHAVSIRSIFYAGFAARLQGIPIVFAVTGLGNLFYGKGVFLQSIRYVIKCFYRFIARREKAVFIVQNNSDKKYMMHFLNAKNQQFFLIPGAGVDGKVFVKKPFYAHAKVRISMLSRMVYAKGVMLFLEAAKTLRHHYDFVLVGGLDEQSSDCVDEKILKDYVDFGYVTWLGHVADVRQVIEESHIVCLPTIGGEGLPKALIEAAFVGRPMIASNVPGCKDIVKHGYNGYLFQEGCADDLIKKIACLASDYSNQFLMGERSWYLAQSYFGIEIITAQTFSVYDVLLT